MNTNVKVYFTGEDGMIKEAGINSGELEKCLKTGFDIGNLNVLKLNGREPVLHLNTVKGRNKRKSIASNYEREDVKTVGDAIEYHRKKTGNKLVVYVTERTEKIAEGFGVLIE